MTKIDIEKNFLENLDYLKQLVKLINKKPVSSFDKNLTYEVIYADTYVESIIPQVKDAKFVATLGAIKGALDLVISEIPIEEVNRQKESKDYRDLIKLKYTDSSEGSYEEDVPYEPVLDSAIGLYCKNRIPSLIFPCLVFFTSYVVRWISDICGTYFPIRGNSQEAVTIFNFLHNILSYAIASFLNSLEKNFNFLHNILFYPTIFILTVTVITTCLDIIYICRPSIRNAISEDKKNKLISIYAKAAIETYDNQLIHFKKVKNYDRIKRNFYWLESMISHMEVMDLNREQAVLYKQLIDVKANFDGSIKHNTAEYYRQVAKIEFLHNKYMRLIVKMSQENVDCFGNILRFTG